jgi:acyl dehydratase
MNKLYYKDFEVNKKYDLGVTTLTEQQIIDFAKQFDPLEFHTDKAAAEKSIFKGIVASGSHIFIVFYRDKWIPLFGHTVICGTGLNNWKLLKPIYPDQKISGSTLISSIQANPEKNYALVTWFHEFRDEKKDLVQSLEVTISHKMK